MPGPPRRFGAAILALVIVSGCDVLGLRVGGPPGPVIPPPTCGGIKVLIENALDCTEVTAIAVKTLAERAPEQVGRGIASIDVMLDTCPAGEVPPQIDCTGVQFAQLVSVTFGPAPPGGPIEPSLTVAIEPVTGRVLGISNPLIL